MRSRLAENQFHGPLVNAILANPFAEELAQSGSTSPLIENTLDLVAGEFKTDGTPMIKGLKTLSLVTALSWSSCIVINAELMLVEKGESLMPIVVAEGLSPRTLQAVDELAGYIEQISGARPEILEGRPDPIPEHAIWIGRQPVVEELFPDVDFEFDQPEEILIHANDSHVVIAGRDVWDPNVTEVSGWRRAIPNPQQEYGTINAIYTFLPDWLGVHWLWPGELGTEVQKSETIRLPAIDFRYAPQFQARSGLFYRYQLGAEPETSEEMEWFRHQRVQLDSWNFPGGHAFTHWAEKYYEDHPEYFALQPNGTRPLQDLRTAKLCHSNPEVWDRWMEDVAAQLQENPLQTVFNASPNDGYTSGHCVCEDCLAWDHPDGQEFIFIWEGASQKYVALTDREVRFANEVGKKLKEAYPDKDYYVMLHAYGYSRPSPVAIEPLENVLISSVSNFHLREDPTVDGGNARSQFDDWSDKAPHLMWRPNLGNGVGRQAGMPLLSVEDTVADFRFVAERNGKGVFFDTIWTHWATQGPYYYLLVHLAWNPGLDAELLMNRYYKAGFGPASDKIAEYWQLLSDTREAASEAQSEDTPYTEIFTEAVFKQAQALLDEAEALVADEPGKYAERVAFVRDGLTYAMNVVDARRWMLKFEASNGGDEEARAEVLKIWEEMQAFRADISPLAISQVVAFKNPKNGRMRGLHPDNPEPPSTRITPAKAAELKDAKLLPAEETGWSLLFVDKFERDELGDQWKIEEGTWTMEGGTLNGSGILVSSEGLPDGQTGYLRLEYDVVSDLESVQLTPDGPALEPSPNDLSAFIHAQDPEQSGTNLINTGYFFQFGGYFNQRNRIARNSTPMATTMNEEPLIEIGQPYTIIAENDAGVLRLWVNGKLVFQETDPAPILGTNFDLYGLFFGTNTKVEEVRVYVKRIEAGYDTD